MPTTYAEDLAACRARLKQGSKSFAAASLLLPERVRQPASAFYAFCRVADDAIDEGDDPLRALEDLRARVDEIWRGAPRAHPVDRALSRVVVEGSFPRAPVDALLEGFEWDVRGRRYADLGAVIEYAARVAASVGVMMTLFMGRRDPRILARACDLGVAMQLSNIARDVGQDARAGRLYLPADWLDASGLSLSSLTQCATAQTRALTQRLLLEAEALYLRSDRGVKMLPRDCRASIRAARLVYSDLHREIQRAGFDTIGQRAVVPVARKLWLVTRALASAASVSVAPGASELPPLPQVRFLTEVAS